MSDKFVVYHSNFAAINIHLFIYYYYLYWVFAEATPTSFKNVESKNFFLEDIHLSVGNIISERNPKSATKNSHSCVPLTCLLIRKVIEYHSSLSKFYGKGSPPPYSSLSLPSLYVIVLKREMVFKPHNRQNIYNFLSVMHKQHTSPTHTIKIQNVTVFLVTRRLPNGLGLPLCVNVL
jgi:hypothetical protein